VVVQVVHNQHDARVVVTRLLRPNTRRLRSEEAAKDETVVSHLELAIFF
jgi:hypothetical protein